MKITELDLQTEGKRYFCKQINEVVEVKEGNIVGTSAQVVLPAEFQHWSVNGEPKNERQLTLSAGEWHFEMSEK